MAKANQKARKMEWNRRLGIAGPAKAIITQGQKEDETEGD